MAIERTPSKSESQLPDKPDPSIRQDFPGAADNKEKIETGKRDVKDKDNKSVRPEYDVPESDAEPVDEQSPNLD